MGYYTKFDLDYDKKIEKQDVMKSLSEINPNYFSVEDDFDETFCETMKWYDHETDMMALSTMYPDIIFTLYGEGEESGDYWVDYYKNGKMQHGIGEIVYEPFNADYFD